MSQQGDFDQPAEPDFGSRTRPRTVGSPGWKLAGILLGVIAVVMIACCGLGIYFFGNMISNEVPAATACAEAFLDDLEAGRVDEAYAGAASVFRGTTTVEQFRNLLAATPIVETHTSRTIRLASIRAGTKSNAIFRVEYQGADGPSGCTLTLVKEDGQWKVAGMRLDASAFQPPDATGGVSSPAGRGGSG